MKNTNKRSELFCSERMSMDQQLYSIQRRLPWTILSFLLFGPHPKIFLMRLPLNFKSMCQCKERTVNTQNKECNAITKWKGWWSLAVIIDFIMKLISFFRTHKIWYLFLLQNWKKILTNVGRSETFCWLMSYCPERLIFSFGQYVSV